MIMSDAQLRMLRSLSKGWPVELIDKLYTRCGATVDEWTALVTCGAVESRDGRYATTKSGRREYGRQKKGRWF